MKELNPLFEPELYALVLDDNIEIENFKTYLQQSFVLFNDALMNIHEFRQSFGIFKSIGMSPFQVRIALVYKSLFLIIISLLAGIPFSLCLSPELISSITKGLGLQEFPYILDGVGTILIVPGMILFTSLSVWWASKKVLLINPKDLVS